MRWNIDERCMEIARYINETGATVRASAKKFGVSKSTVHKDVTSRLFKLNRELFERTNAVLQKNKLERHLRGGAATRAKYKGDGDDAGSA